MLCYVMFCYVALPYLTLAIEYPLLNSIISIHLRKKKKKMMMIALLLFFSLKPVCWYDFKKILMSKVCSGQRIKNFENKNRVMLLFTYYLTVIYN